MVRRHARSSRASADVLDPLDRRSDQSLGGFVMPLLALYLTGERGLSVEQAGLVVSLYGAGALLSGPLEASSRTIRDGGARW